MSSRLRWHQYLSLSGVYLGFSFLWNSLHPIILPILLLTYGPEETKNTRLGVLTFFGLVVAMVVQPLAGALSDRTSGRWGRRGAWLVGGSAVALVGLFGLGTASRFWMLAASYLGLQMASNAALGPGNALIPDLVSPQERGLASGGKNLLEMAGIILAAAITGALMAGERPRVAANLVLVGAMVVAGLLVTLHNLLGRASTGARVPAEPRRGPSGLLRDLVRLSLGDHPGYVRLMWSRFWLILATYVLQAFGLYYLRDVMDLPDPAAAMGSLMISIGLSLTVVTLPAGALSERVGRRLPVALGCVLVMVSLALFLAVPANESLLRVLGVVVGAGMGMFMTVNWAWATDLAPAGEAGKFLGLANLASAAASALSRLMGPLIDALNRWRAEAGYSLVFVLAAAAAGVALYHAMRIPETRGRPALGAETPVPLPPGGAE